jgi:hypothetical protein
MKGFTTAALTLTAIALCFWGVVIYAAIHFLSKFW